MALFKKCPVFLKEKEIRNIMMENNCTYRKGLELYLRNNETKNVHYERRHNYIQKNTQQSVVNLQDESALDRPEPSYRDVLVTEALVHNERGANLIETEDQHTNKYTQKKRVFQKQREGATREATTTTRHPQQQEKNSEESCWSQAANPEKEPGSDELKKTFSMYSIYKRIREVCLSEGNWFTKFKLLVKLVIDICGQWFYKILNGDDLWKLMSLFNNG